MRHGKDCGVGRAGTWPGVLLLAGLLASTACGATGSARPATHGEAARLLAPVPAPVASTLVPAPREWRAGVGRVVLGADARIAVDARGADAAGAAEARRTAQLFADALQRSRGLTLRIDPATGVAAHLTSTVTFVLDPALLGEDGDEAYRLDVTPAGIRLSARAPHGLFNAAMSLLQLATSTPGRGPVAIPAQAIADAPRFGWRGLMLDSARHMQSPDEVRGFIDAMALHKLDVLQWHLTDDQGWRLQILKYPALTDVGAWRRPAGAAGTGADGKPARYGGYYTQEEVRALVAYAAARYITIVPEIDLPGHAQAAIAAYPEFGTVPAPGVSPDWGIHEYLFNADEATFRFLEDVLDEVLALFPSRYVHVGGDEVVTAQWAASPAVRARLDALGVKDVGALQGVFTTRMQRYLAARGRRLVGWDEILHGGLPGDATVMSWQGVKGAELAAREGHDTVLAPWPTLYFDNRQAEGTDEPPGRLRVVSLQDVYAFDPVPPGIAPAQAHHVLGLQAAVWTEHIRTMPRVDWMTFPRAAAVAETGWSSPAHRDWNDFVRRLPGLFASYDALGIGHADSAYVVAATPTYDVARARATVTMATQVGGAAIRYTTDGSEPSARARAYAAPLSLALPTTLKAASFADAQRLSRTTTLRLDTNAARTRDSEALARCSDGIALALEDDAPAQGAREVFHLDIQNPCWLFRDAPLDGIVALSAEVGSLPFNFQIGADAAKIRFDTPITPAGELVVRLDRCDGPELARLPLAPATGRAGLSTLPPVRITAPPGRHDLCLRFAQPRLDPEWALARIRLLAEPAR